MPGNKAVIPVPRDFNAADARLFCDILYNIDKRCAGITTGYYIDDDDDWHSLLTRACQAGDLKTVLAVWAVFWADDPPPVDDLGLAARHMEFRTRRRATIHPSSIALPL